MYKLYNSLLTFAVSKGNNFIKFKNSSFVACICEDMCHICFYEKKIISLQQLYRGITTIRIKFFKIVIYEFSNF